MSILLTIIGTIAGLIIAGLLISLIVLAAIDQYGGS